jgi:2OG-Fe(II) oxygenase superfamily
MRHAARSKHDVARCGSAGVTLESIPRVSTRRELRARDVLDVAEGRTLALVIPHYYEPEVCAALAAQLLASQVLWTNYPDGSGAEHIATLGSALYGCLGEKLSPDCVEYFRHAAARNRALRGATAPFQLPADRVRVELDNDWPGGTTLLRIDGRPAFYGLCRHVRSGGGIEPHTDRVDWDLPCPETSVFRTQLFLNVYLTQTQSGGDLELWTMDVPTRADYDELRSKEFSFALDRALLPEPAATISIEPGTLVVANASKPHAVTPCIGVGERLSVSGFLGYRDPDAPLRAFS